jgi:hypothetical protein
MGRRCGIFQLIYPWPLPTTATCTYWLDPLADGLGRSKVYGIFSVEPFIYSSQLGMIVAPDGGLCNGGIAIILRPSSTRDPSVLAATSSGETFPSQTQSLPLLEHK